MSSKTAENSICITIHQITKPNSEDLCGGDDRRMASGTNGAVQAAQSHCGDRQRRARLRAGTRERRGPVMASQCFLIAPEEPSGDVQHLPELQSFEFREETWGAEEVRRHWLLSNHCERLLVPLAYPSLRMPSALGAYYWRKHTTDARQTFAFLAEEQRCVSAALRDLALYTPQPQQLVWCEQLMASLAHNSKAHQAAIRYLTKFLTAQRGLVTVSLENARLEMKEALPLLRDLGAATGGCLRHLYLWHAFRRRLEPVALRSRGRRRDACASGAWRRGPTMQAPGGPAQLPLTRALPLFSALTVLAANYCDLADPCGEALLTLAAVRAGTLRHLHLLVVEQELPRRSQGGESFGAVPDWAWRRALLLCPQLKVHLVIIACPCYDMVASVMSRSMPLAQLQLSSGIDSHFRQPWLLDCVFRDMRIWFTDTLEYLALHLWRNRDRLDADLVRAFTDFPHLIELEFIGRFEDLKTIQRICDFLLKGERPLQKLVLRPQLQLVSGSGRAEGGTEDAAQRERLLSWMRRYQPRFAQRELLFDCSPFPV